ncbi:hypothetical protein CHAB381_1468 [Campylobacter hominis ATCC BAA-381]|uniref:Uncharacterized protein n=1 Tax=Campylobacter hominis (strain ATCC BAA-381 / DSM 21671 / CCUG 45161 / LMG 19568 / NCTC 13146 / CH001A) TaxID=360107 RepID=A7I3B3_CAMHC|nr:hypothetical protein CHAB381_1468 [Campylobacter hominis ATCC BAA-381]
MSFCFYEPLKCVYLTFDFFIRKRCVFSFYLTSFKRGYFFKSKKSKVD